MWKNILKRNFSVGDVVVPNFYDTRYPVNDSRRINDSGLFLVVSVEGDKVRVEEISNPNEKIGRPIERELPASNFDYFTDDFRRPDTSERDAERAFESRLFGGKRD